ncbi:MAG: ice-binding family protein [Candidatus Nitrotoga sp.]
MNKFSNIKKPMILSTTILLAAILAGCSDGGGTGVNTGLGATGAVCAGASCVNLGTAGNYAILAKAGVSSVPSSVITGNIGLSPAARTFLTGWSLITEPTDTSFGSAQVSGRLFAADNVLPTPTQLTTAVGDMQTAYTAAAQMAPAGGGLTTACPGTGNFGGLTIVPGVYTCTAQVLIPTGTILTLSGSATDVWVFKMAGGFDQAAATEVVLAGGALAKNVFWQSAQTVTIGTTAKMKGVILSQTNIVMGTGSTLNGRLLAQTAVTLDQATVTQP